jgi:serine/threonine protein kinase
MMEELGTGSFVTPTVRLLTPLAEGGMGMVWIAEHLVLETKVCVKLMTKEVAANVGGAARFSREAAIAAAVKSPHVVQVFDSGVTREGVAYIVMELLEGHDLGAHLTANGRMAPAEVTILVTQLAKALAKAHRVQVVHRDLKPENVFLCDVEGGEAFVKLLDFGTAKDEARAQFTTTAGQLVGTPYYMSPEQILGEEVDTRADIWSLGVLAFEAITGTRPFEGITVGAITLAIHTTKPRMTDVVPELPPALDEWFARACARDPNERFQTARAAGDAFARAVSGDATILDSSPELLVESVPGMPAAFPSSGRLVAVPRRAATSGERVATSLSSTLHSPRNERRVVQWIAVGVVTASVLGMTVFFAYEDPNPATPVAPTPVAAMAPPPAASLPAASPAPSPSSSPSAPPPPSPLPSASATPPPAHPPPTSPATASAKLPPTFPFPSAAPSAAPSASARAPAPAPALAPAPASAFAPEPAAPEPAPPAPAPPSATPVPPPPLDLHDLLPPASPPP